jgi:hypothetical protein
VDTTNTANLTDRPQNIRECRAAATGAQGFGECLCEGPNSCEFALPFGYAFLCQHPRVQEIVENTRKAMHATESV